MENRFAKIFGAGWATALNDFLHSEDMRNIGKELKALQAQGKTVQPELAHVFDSFKNCCFDDVKAVWLMKIPNIKKVNDKICEVIAESIYKDTGNCSQHIWKTKDVLMLPLNLTTCIGEDHTKLWEPFIKAVLKALHYKPVIYLFVGQDAHQYDKFANPTYQDYYYVEHPMKAILEKREWHTHDLFNTIDRISNMLYNKKIYGTNKSGV